jgi:hypothetical protein
MPRPDAPTWWSAGDGGITVSVRVTPGARRNEVIDATGAQLRVRITAPPVDGKANEQVRRFVAELFGVRPRAVSLVSGARSREKRLFVAGISAPPAAPMRPST